VTRIIFEGGRAVGVEVEQGGRTKRYRAAEEVILSGGAINSPHLLLLSGIGDADKLRQVKIIRVFISLDAFIFNNDIRLEWR
jgi:choline dehydrogenase